MNQKERMLAGLPYKAWMDGLQEERTTNKKKVYELEFVKQVVCVAVDGAGCGAGVCLRL